MVAWSLACFVPFLQHGNEHVSTEHTPQTPRASTFSSPRNVRPMIVARLDAISPGAEIIPAVREGVAEAGNAEPWEESIAVLAEKAALDEEEAEMVLADGLNWKAWAKASPTMRRYARPMQPDAAKLEEALRWLNEGPLELDQERLQGALRGSPKVYLVSPEEKYHKAMAAAPEKYKAPSAFREALLADPSVLDCYYNCDEADEGCASECGNCWVAFERR
mmetsp:Transcript_15638/g.45123  ORF Transcript_15638/g.45123 Transcript_15638/m.45123 type:complete len:220 (-) Transcript_15638:336-995(-)|eukprot:CAMPEP_0113553650 /NCGR_PEP_ID=MMETSP0015_2-20120614/15728_1 /TAXON_ID=2838 /ORGANISM="Odontella" /LENGTH=219 /DNA_ID=CAMNT_0000454737 /DNA_START=79 /DNA_END=738 /DNA_ORIENTATION=+ /assembly_acc=CAM_ASM_000160